MVRKYICLLVCLIFLTGCDSFVDANVVDYELNIDKTISEKIIVGLSGNAYDIANIDVNSESTAISLEYSLLNENQNPVFGNHDDLYNKRIIKRNNGVTVLLDYEYIENDFLYNNYIMSCFEKYAINSKEDTLEILLSGKFYCFDNNGLEKVNINVNTRYDVISSNGDKTEKGYSWQINRNNYENVNINYMISRDFKGMADKVNNSNNIIIDLVKLFGLIVCLFVIYILYKRMKNKIEI